MEIEKVVNLCARRGFVFPNSEIYGSPAGFYDYGPFGAELKRNVENSWWNTFVTSRNDVVGIDGSIITHPMVWKASGHAEAFNDPLVECTKCKSRFRADHLIEKELKLTVDGVSLEGLGELIKTHKLVCEKCKGELGAPRVFNMMFKTHVGPVEDEANVAYLRPETAQLMFVDFKLVQATSRKALPFGIAQIGKSFRNEISPRNFVFRLRELSQMEMEFFIHPEKLNDCPAFESVKGQSASFYTQEMQENKSNMKQMTFENAVSNKVIGTVWHAYWLAECLSWLYSLGIRKEKLRLRQHVKTELSHYSSETWDIEYDYPDSGWKELQGIANRGDFDLKQHQTHSKKDLTLFDEASKQKILPHVIEPAIGVDRTILTLLIDAYEEKKEAAEIKTVLKLSPKIAPVKCAVFPLMKKDALPEKARLVYEELKKTGFKIDYDEAGSIGKRYARNDEIGTPYCVTIDYESLEGQTNDTVTLRDRDTGSQKRIHYEKLTEILKELVEGSTSFAAL